MVVVGDFSLVLDISAVIREAKSMMEVVEYVEFWRGRWGKRWRWRCPVVIACKRVDDDTKSYGQIISRD